MGLTSDPNCTICQNAIVGTMYHVFWECLVIDRFWTQVCCDLEKLTGCNFTLFPRLCLLNDDSLNLGAMDKIILFLARFNFSKKDST